MYVYIYVCVCVCVCVCRGTEIVIGRDQIIIIFIVPVVKRKEVIIKVYKFYKVNYWIYRR